jgi:hypothetical protein
MSNVPDHVCTETPTFGEICKTYVVARIMEDLKFVNYLDSVLKRERLNPTSIVMAWDKPEDKPEDMGRVKL